MSPKTGLNDKENNMETMNQLNNQISTRLSNNEELNQNSTINSIKLGEELNFKLNFKLNFRIRDQLIVILNEFTTLLYDDENQERIMRVFEKSNALMHNLVDLPLKIDHIEENEINLLNSNLLEPTLIINSKMKTEITDLLIKNKNFSILFGESGNKNAKSNLMNENNNLLIKIMQLPIQMLKRDTQVDSTGQKALNNQSICTDQTNLSINKLEQKLTKSEKEVCELKQKISNLKDDQLVTKSEHNKEISNFRKEIHGLKEKILNLNLSANEKESVTIYYKFNNISNFLYSRREHKIPSFKCLGLDWNLVLKTGIMNGSSCLFFELNLINTLNFNKKCKTNCQILILDQKKTKLFNGDRCFSFDSIFAINQSCIQNTHITISDLLYNFINIQDKVLFLQINLTAEWINYEYCNL